ncbi:MAG: HYR domain-containing protein, partial [Verrucomicrobia bacterium]|nr:HYR domain-containing protein [Verrucomicrobiota bacterium]
LVNAPGGVYCYTLNFNIPCPTNVPIKASLNGQWMADDTGTIYLNGAPTGNTLPNGWAFTNWQAIAINSGFVPGLNTLTFYVTNGGAGPTGIRLELTGTASCCACGSTNCTVSINCPGNTNIVTCNPAGDIVVYPLPTASSSCGIITNLVCSPPSGSAFPIGTTTVTCTATDSLGSSATCTFTVTVAQAPPPYIICPPLNLGVTGCPPLMPDLTSLITVITNCPTTRSVPTAARRPLNSTSSVALRTPRPACYPAARSTRSLPRACRCSAPLIRTCRHLSTGCGCQIPRSRSGSARPRRTRRRQAGRSFTRTDSSCARPPRRRSRAVGPRTTAARSGSTARPPPMCCRSAGPSPTGIR